MTARTDAPDGRAEQGPQEPAGQGREDSAGSVREDSAGQGGRDGSAGSGREWYRLSAPDVAAALEVDPATGLSSARAAEVLRTHGPNALPEEKPLPGWKRYLAQYRSYMQLVLVAAAVVSLVIKEWSTGVLCWC
ncbi:cation-transporting P-type ATPase [Streptomyces chartreusis]|uniref:cation-transporting P-type ATPase n=1 Tax=Streptomyces TaxID=1883 RepID=UPI00115FEA31